MSAHLFWDEWWCKQRSREVFEGSENHLSVLKLLEDLDEINNTLFIAHSYSHWAIQGMCLSSMRRWHLYSSKHNCFFAILITTCLLLSHIWMTSDYYTLLSYQFHTVQAENTGFAQEVAALLSTYVPFQWTVPDSFSGMSYSLCLKIARKHHIQTEFAIRETHT